MVFPLLAGRPPDGPRWRGENGRVSGVRRRLLLGRPCTQGTAEGSLRQPQAVPRPAVSVAITVIRGPGGRCGKKGNADAWFRPEWPVAFQPWLRENRQPVAATYR